MKSAWENDEDFQGDLNNVSPFHLFKVLQLTIRHFQSIRFWPASDPEWNFYY